MTDHLAEARAAIHAEHGWSMAAPASSLADMAYAIARILDHLEAAHAPDVDWKTIAGSADAVTRAWTAAEIDKAYGPLTFAPRPADTPTAAPQPEPDPLDESNHADPARPAETHTDNIRAEAWDEGWRTGYADGAHYDDPRITPNPYRKEQP